MTPLAEWAVKREALRYTKAQGGKPPWTADPILREYRFCNVRRRHDRVSLWLQKHVVNGEQLNRVGVKSFLTFTAFCRWNNWPPLIAEVLPCFRSEIYWRGIVDRIEDRKRRGEKAWTGAYMIMAPEAKLSLTKAQFVVNICRALEPKIPEIEAGMKAGSRQKVWETLCGLHSWGSFMAGQVVDDWSWTILLNAAKDSNTWAPQGPGSLRGLNRIEGYDLHRRWKPEEWCQKLQGHRKEVVKALEEAFGRSYRDVTLMDVQNCLCETDKYLRVKQGEGRPRSRYRPEAAY